MKNTDELQHFGIKGMKWKKHKAKSPAQILEEAKKRAAQIRKAMGSAKRTATKSVASAKKTAKKLRKKYDPQITKAKAAAWRTGVGAKIAASKLSDRLRGVKRKTYSSKSGSSADLRRAEAKEKNRKLKKQGGNTRSDTGNRSTKPQYKGNIVIPSKSARSYAGNGMTNKDMQNEKKIGRSSGLRKLGQKAGTRGRKPKISIDERSQKRNDPRGFGTQYLRKKENQLDEYQDQFKYSANRNRNKKLIKAYRAASESRKKRK